MVADINHELDFEYRTDQVYTSINGSCAFSDWKDSQSVSVHSKVFFRYQREDVDAEKLPVVYLFREG